MSSNETDRLFKELDCIPYNPYTSFQLTLLNRRLTVFDTPALKLMRKPKSKVSCQLQLSPNILHNILSFQITSLFQSTNFAKVIKMKNNSAAIKKRNCYDNTISISKHIVYSVPKKRGKVMVNKIYKHYLTIGSLRIDDFRTTTPLDCVTYLLRMPVLALAGVE